MLLFITFLHLIPLIETTLKVKVLKEKGKGRCETLYVKSKRKE